MASQFDILNWYWIVADNTDQIFSSASLTYVPPDDVNYLAFLDGGKAATNIANGRELIEVISRLYVPRAVTSVELISTSTPGLNSIYALDTATQQQISGISTGIAAGKGIPGGGTHFNFNGVVFTSVQFLAVASALESYLYNFMMALTTTIMSGQNNPLPPVPIVIA